MSSVKAAVLASVFAASGCAGSGRVADAPAADLQMLIRSVSVLDTETGTVSAPQDILIADGRIAFVGLAGATSVPAGTPEIDGTGLFAMPGLIDAHAHVGEGGIAPQNDETRKRALGQFLRYGVTSIFVPGATGAGDADFPTLRANCAAEPGTCPGLFGSGSLITAVGSHPVSTIFGMGPDTPADVIEARGVTVLTENTDIDALMAAKAAKGFHAVKIIIEDGPPPWYPMPRLTDAQVSAIVAAAHAHDLKVFAHISGSAQVDIAARLGVDGIMHAPIDVLPDETAAQMAAQGMWYVPTFALYDGILTWARAQPEPDPYALKGVEPSALASLANEGFLGAAHEPEALALSYLENASANLRKAEQAGVPIALGSDVSNPFVYPGYSAHEELDWMVRAGLTPAQALRAGTLGAAEMLGQSESVGRIAEGYEADILILDRNPFEDVLNSRRLVTVISDGRSIGDVVSAR